MISRVRAATAPAWLASDGRSSPIPGVAAFKRRASSRMSRYLGWQGRQFVGNAPVVCFTFDDVPETAATNGARMLEDVGARGTHYIATGLLGRATEHFTILDESGVVALHRAGHEIALHSHAHLAAHSHSRTSFEEDLKKNLAALAALDPTIAPRHFAYPYGAMSVSSKLSLGGMVASSRSVDPGLNVGRFDAQNVRAVELCDRILTPAELDSYLDRARQQCAWLVFVLHDVAREPSPFGCSIGLLRRALDGVMERGMRFATMNEAFAETRAAPSRWLFSD